MRKLILSTLLGASVLGLTAFTPTEAKASWLSESLHHSQIDVNIGAPYPAYYAPPVYAPVPTYTPPAYVYPTYSAPTYAPAPVYAPVPVPVYRPAPVYVPRPSYYGPYRSEHERHEWREHERHEHDWRR